MSEINSYTFSFVQNVQSQRQNEAQAAKGNGSYLMALALMLGEIADKMLDRVMDLAGDLDNLQDKKAEMKNDKKDPGGMGENKLTAELQAQTQIMNMFMQAMTTVIKSVGEANKDVARKQ
ncbi:hypothetical protein [Luteimonas arsenica]|uniref:hypothetical protein n=1 Tax=Luteimonas arsenica TaxID=1586242 RepID=UPI0010567596|nr:hypothetical protein [Luteimonas arsenica]